MRKWDVTYLGSNRFVGKVKDNLAVEINVLATANGGDSDNASFPYTAPLVYLDLPLKELPFRMRGIYFCSLFPLWLF